MPFDFKTNFFFIYDTSFCKSDDEDPKDAVVVFLPVQASESQGHFLCCQLAGVAKFLKTTFNSPAVIGFAQGKFALTWSGSYLVGLGADSDVSSSVLRDRLVFLCRIFCFYHGNMDSVERECGSNRGDFLLQLELCWSRYVALSEQGIGSALQHSSSPHRRPPKADRKLQGGGSSVASIASRLLHLCQMSSFVTAGAVFHDSRVVSTQFAPQLTHYLSLLSNSNAAAPVRDVPMPLPPDVDLKLVHLSPGCVSGIRRLNHASAGSRVRLKHQGGVRSSSGSEADVDSGNGSESRVRRDSEARKGIREESECCSGILERGLAASQNRCLLSWTRFGLREDCGRVDTKRQSVFGAGSLLCTSHAHLRSASFLTESALRPTRLTSSADAEFRCPSCRSDTHLTHVGGLSLKRWNSDFHISKSMLFCDCSSRPPSRRSSSRTDPTKVQILKCRSDSRCHRARRRRIHFSKRHAVGHHPEGNDGVSESDSCDKDECVNIEENDLQKHVLYIQRYGRSTLVLLLDKIQEEKVIHYLWNGGFTALRELEFSTDKQEVGTPLNIEPSFYILLYDHVQKTLKEYPRFLSLPITERHSKQTIQKMHEDFNLDPHLRTMCLLSSGCSIFASHRDRTLAVYLQPEANSRKVDALLHLEERAARRLAKYFRVEVLRDSIADSTRSTSSGQKCERDNGKDTHAKYL